MVCSALVARTRVDDAYSLTLCDGPAALNDASSIADLDRLRSGLLAHGYLEPWLAAEPPRAAHPSFMSPWLQSLAIWSRILVRADTGKKRDCNAAEHRDHQNLP